MSTDITTEADTDNKETVEASVPPVTIWHYHAWLLDESGKTVHGAMEEFSCEYSEEVAMARAYYRASKMLKPKVKQAVKISRLKMGPYSD